MRYFDFLSSERNQTPVTMIQKKTHQHPLDLLSGHFLSEAPCTFLRFLNPQIIHLFEIFAVADYMLFREIILKKTCFSP